jgi:imidazolonepropionase
MIEADLAVTGIAELATPTGTTPRSGSDLGRLHIVPDAAIAARSGVIVFVGTERDYRQTVTLIPGAQCIDAQRGTVLPGFVDAHTHLAFAGWREREFDERLRGATYSEIAARGGGILTTVTATRAASEEQLVELTRARLDAMLRLGTTTVEVKSGYGLTVEDELKQLRAVETAAKGHPVEVVPTFLGAHTIPAEHRADRRRWIDILTRDLLPTVAGQRLAEYADAFVDAHALTPDEARRVLGAAREHGLGVRLHADQLHDDGATALAAELGAASADHLEFASDAGLEALARAGSCGVLLPVATFFTRVATAPPGRRLVQAGVPVVVATDFNPGTCPMESMPLAVAFACVGGGLSVDEAITAATLNAACALGRGSRTGSLEVGKRADLVVLAVPNRYHLAYRMGLAPLAHVVARGQSVGAGSR